MHWGSFGYILKGLNTCGFTIECYGEIVFLQEKYFLGLIVMKLHRNYPYFRMCGCAFRVWYFQNGHCCHGNHESLKKKTWFNCNETLQKGSLGCFGLHSRLTLFGRLCGQKTIWILIHFNTCKNTHDISYLFSFSEKKSINTDFYHEIENLKMRIQQLEKA